MRSLRSKTPPRPPVRLNVAKVHVPLSVVIAAWAGKKIGSSLARIVRWPARLLPLAALAAPVLVLQVLGIGVLASAVALFSAVLLVWRVMARETFTRLFVWRLRGWWRSRRVYRFGWQPAMVTTGLAARIGADELLPEMVRVRSTASVDRVWVRMLPGQVLEDYAAVAPRLAQTFGVRECRVRSTVDRQQLILWFLVHDPLTDVVMPLDRSQGVDFAGLPVGRREDGPAYLLRLLGSHLLVVGATGSGKGSVIWSLLHTIAPAIRDRLVVVWALDPKGGMELAPGRGLFARFSYGDPHDGSDHEAEFARVLEDAVDVMRRRQSALRGRTRLHEPTIAEPLIVVVVDEIASLTAYVTDREAKRRIASALSLLLSQGRAVGVLVVGAVQDPRKEILTVRDLFPTRVVLRVSEPEHVGLVLGPGARDRGARADLIPESLPGVGYVAIDGIAEPVRVRFSYLTDEDIADLSRDFAPRSVAVGAVTAA